jgi:hypothetical protein
MDRTAYASGLRNLHSWAGHLAATIESAVPQVLVELGPVGEERPEDARNAAEAFRAVAQGIDDVMNAFDSLLEVVQRPRRYDDFLQGLDDFEPEADSDPNDGEADDFAVNRARFHRLAGELHFDSGWLLGSIHGAMVCHDEDEIDDQLDSLATGIEEVMISYDRIQDLIGALPGRHCAFFEAMVVLEDGGRHRRRGH